MSRKASGVRPRGEFTRGTRDRKVEIVGELEQENCGLRGRGNADFPLEQKDESLRGSGRRNTRSKKGK